MADSYDIEITVISQKGTCGVGHKVGDKWVVSGSTPAGICNSAYHDLYPDIRILRFNGILPWNKDPDVTRLACSDYENPVVFELKRIRKKS
jgi:uncharacterized repeat protein (TIGR04076 family)